MGADLLAGCRTCRVTERERKDVLARVLHYPRQLSITEFRRDRSRNGSRCGGEKERRCMTSPLVVVLNWQAESPEQ